MPSTRTNAFDPAAHLTKQGWKGKGTAFKPGHATRHLATVKKRDLGGLGKNRDEAQPFWDHIFATTAASLSLPSSGTSTPLAPASPSPASPGEASRPSMGGPSRPSGSAWQTQSTPSISISARVGREVARRGLYSRFFRGSKATEPPEIEQEQSEEIVTPDLEAGTHRKRSVATEDSTHGEGSKAAQREAVDERVETKEERRARRAEKKRRKEEKGQQAPAADDAELVSTKATNGTAEPRRSQKGRRRDQADGEVRVGSDERVQEQVERKKEKRKKDRTESDRAEKKRKRPSSPS